MRTKVKTQKADQRPVAQPDDARGVDAVQKLARLSRPDARIVVRKLPWRLFQV
jgi:hypothetical protein